MLFDPFIKQTNYHWFGHFRRMELAQLENLVVKMIRKQLSDVPVKTLGELMKIEEFRTYLKEAKKILSQYEQK